MTQVTLGDVAHKIRSKNAGPFWLTIDIFCDTDTAFGQVCRMADTTGVAQALGIPAAQLHRYEIPSLRVLKFSLHRPQIQGTAQDRDMHGASFANLIAALPG